MGLDSLFKDREVRKLVKESVYNAEDNGKNICESCGEESFHTFNVFGKCLCESCSEKLIEESNNYDECFESVNDLTKYFVSEGYVIANLRKLEADANAKFGGNIKDLLNSYNLGAKDDWNYRYHEGLIWLNDSVFSSGKSNINKFMNDYSCGFRSSKFPNIVPDSDGTTYTPVAIGKSDPIRKDNLAVVSTSVWNRNISNGKSNSSSTQAQTVATQAKTNVVPTAPAPAQAPQKANPTIKNTKPVTDIKSAGLKLKGDLDSFSVVVDNEDILKCGTVLDANGTRTANVTGNVNKTEVISVGNLSEVKDVAECILNAVVTSPDKFFKSFDGESNEISINSYDFYKFVLDAKSFENGKFSLALKFRNKIYQNVRYILSVKALSSRTALISELEKTLEDKIREQYPSLFDGKNILKTSLGKVEFELEDMDDNNNPILSFAIGDAGVFTCTVTDKNKFKTEDPKIYFSNLILNNIKKVIKPGWENYDKHGTGNLEYDYGDDKTGYWIYANFDKNEFLDSGNFVFKCSIIDKLHGIEQPKTQKKVVYNKTTPLLQFLEKVGKDIYREYFKESNMKDVITASASEKMKNPSKRIALFDKARDIFLTNNKGLKKDLGDYELEVSFNVNKDGKLVDAKITITDPYAECDSKDLFKFMEHKDLKNIVGKTASYNDFKSVHKVTFEVKDLQKFADAITFSILESMVFEAFELVSESADGRKTFYM